MQVGTAQADPDELARGWFDATALPTLNPAGLRRTARTAYYHDDDPNRYFPDPESEEDLHTAQVGSMPFVIRDRVLYGENDALASMAVRDDGDLVVERD